MSVMYLTGSLYTLREKAWALLRVVRRRQAEGFKLFQPDEEWIYRSEGDARVCPFCRGFENDNPWRGDEIPHFFPRRILEGTGVNLVVRPNVHETPGLTFLHRECRCTMRMVDMGETFERRLHKEKLNVI